MNDQKVDHQPEKITDRAEMINMLAEDPLNLQFASEELLKDSTIVALAVCKNGMALQFAPAFQNDRHIVTLALHQNLLAWHYVDPAMENNSYFFAPMVQANPNILLVTSPRTTQKYLNRYPELRSISAMRDKIAMDAAIATAKNKGKFVDLIDFNNPN